MASYGSILCTDCLFAVIDFEWTGWLSRSLNGRENIIVENNIYDQLILFMKNLLEQLIDGKIFPDDVVRESETLKSYFMSLGLWIGVSGVKNNNMHVSNL